MTHQTGALPAHLFHGQLDSRVDTFLAIIEHRDDPRDLNPLRIIGGMVVFAVVSEFFHGASQPAFGSLTVPGRAYTSRRGATRGKDIPAPRAVTQGWGHDCEALGRALATS